MYFIIVLLLFSIISLDPVSSHGLLLDPVNRASRWRFDSSAPVDYDDNQGFCGGFNAQWYIHKGRCGLCGDDFGLPTPRPHEYGGEYGDGTIVKSYRSNGQIPVTVLITANHFGYFLFDLCNMDTNVESEECFSAHNLTLATGGYEYRLTNSNVGWFNATLLLPNNLSCDHCVLRWTYVTGNFWGKCLNNTEAVGCGKQEHFRSCSDIAILGDEQNVLEDVSREIPGE